VPVSYVSYGSVSLAKVGQRDGSVDQDLRLALVELMPRLRRFGVALTRSLIDADDLVQAACERALLRRDQLRRDTKIGAWMYQIMRNLWIDEMRSRRTHQHAGIETAHDVIGVDGEAVVERSNAWAAVRRTLNELPMEQRVALILVCVDGISYKETAAILGIPIGTVTSRVARGRHALHERLGSGLRSTMNR
jgi:RNA polymerase sigma-70 factor (ECF subfamily)